jgi:hypothetical protein
MSDFDRRLAELAGEAGGAARLAPASVLRQRGRRRAVRRRAFGGTLVAVLVFAPVAALSNCLGSPNPPGPEPGVSSSPTPEQSTTPPTTTAPTGAPSASQIGACRTGQLVITISDDGRDEGGAGHSSTALLLRNNGSTPCSLHGYPKVAALDSGARTVAEARQTPEGYMGGLASGEPPTVTLAPGQAASALFETLNANPDGTACKSYAALRVTPPGQPDSVTVTWGFGGCANPEIHPVVPGSSGRRA